MRIFTYLDQYSFEEAALLISHLAHTHTQKKRAFMYLHCNQIHGKQ